MKDNNQSQNSEDIKDSNVNQILGNNDGNIFNANIININGASSATLIKLDQDIEKILDNKLPSYLRDSLDNQIPKLIKSYLEIVQVSINLNTQNIVDAKLDQRLQSNDFKSCLANTIDQIIVKEDKAPLEVLAGLIKDKLSDDDESYLINQAIDTMKYLNKNQVNFLGFIHLLQRRLIQVDEIYIEDQAELLYSYLEKLKKELEDESDLEIKHKNQEEFENIMNSIKVFKNKIRPNISDIYKNFFNKFLSLNPRKLDIDYLISLGLFYTHYTSPVDRLKVNLCQAVSIDEIDVLNIFPEFNELLMKYDIESKDVLAISSLGDKIGIIVYENIKNSFRA